MKLTVKVNGKSYEIEYTKSANSYTVKSDNDDLRPHISNSFTFWIQNGDAMYLTTSDKTHQIARQIIQQINEAEIKKRR